MSAYILLFLSISAIFVFNGNYRLIKKNNYFSNELERLKGNIVSEELFKRSTIPLTSKPDTRPTFQQFREHYRLSYFEIAQQAKVRVCRVYWMELGYRTEFELALRILAVLSKHVGEKVRFEEMQGIRLKQSFLV